MLINRFSMKLGWLILTVISVILVGFSQNVEQKNNSQKLGFFVTTKDGNIVTNIQKEDLEIKIKGKWYSDFTIEKQVAPVLYVLSVDNSGSMRFELTNIVNASKKIISQNNSTDGTLLMRFVNKEKIQITNKFTSDKIYLNKILDNFFIEGGQTALIDAIYKSVEIVAGQKSISDNYRRFIVVISDGEDRSSEKNKEQLIELLKKENIQVFFIGLINVLDDKGGLISKSSKKAAKEFIEEIVNSSGGVAVYPKKSEYILNSANKIVPLMREQQFINLKSSESLKSSEIEVKLTKPLRKKKLKIYTHLLKP